MGSSDAVLAMQQGAIDMSLFTSPFWKAIENMKIAQFVPGSGYSLSSLIMPVAFEQQQPEVAKAILRAIVRTHRTYLQGDYHKDAKVVAAMAKTTGVQESTITASDPLVFTTDLQYTKDAEQSITDAQTFWAQAGGLLSYTTPLALDKINDTSLAKAVVAGQ
jgi:NitT/TauT family transport system substrate-binding protein